MLRVVGRLCLLGWADRCLGGGLVGRALPLHLRDLRLRLGLPFLEVDAPVIAAPSSPLGWWALVYRRALFFVGRRRASLVFAKLQGHRPPEHTRVAAQRSKEGPTGIQGCRMTYPACWKSWPRSSRFLAVEGGQAFPRRHGYQGLVCEYSRLALRH